VEDIVTAKQKEVAAIYKEIAKEIARGVSP